MSYGFGTSAWGGGNGAFANASSPGIGGAAFSGGAGGGGGGGMGGMSYSGLIGGLLGTGVGALEGSYLGAPGVADPKSFTPTLLNLNDSIQSYFKDFQGGLGNAETMAGETNKFDINQALSAYTAMQPQFENLQKQIGQNALSMSQGNLPSDVVSSIGRAAASQGIQGGFAGGGGPSGSSFAGMNMAGSNLDLRNLGMISLDISNMGNNLGMQLDSQAKALSPVLSGPMDFLPSFQTALGVDQMNSQMINSADLSNLTAQNNYQQQLLNSQYTKKMNLVNSMMEGASVGASMCWVAREVFGEDNPEWQKFKEWLLLEAPMWFFRLYAKCGEKFAAWMGEADLGYIARAVIHPWMKWIIKGRKEAQVYYGSPAI